MEVHNFCPECGHENSNYYTRCANCQAPLIKAPEIPVEPQHLQHPITVSRQSSDGWWTVAGIILFLLLISPLDPAPDIIPVVGWIDDILYMAGIWYIVSRNRER